MTLSARAPMRSIIRQGLEAIVLKSSVGQRVKGLGPAGQGSKDRGLGPRARSEWAGDRGLIHSVVGDLIVLKRKLVQCTIYAS